MTIRGIEADLMVKLQEAARHQGKSVNRLIVDILKEHIGVERGKQFTAVHRDMDHLFGRWSQEEFRTIQGKIDMENQVD